jgi:hypothetical protein
MYHFDAVFLAMKQINTNIQLIIVGWLLIIPFVVLGTNEFITIYGDEEVSSRSDDILIQYEYGISTQDVVTTIASTGTVQSSSSLALICTGTNATASAQIQSKRTLVLLGGHEGDVFFSAAFTGGSTLTSTQWIGLFDSNNGFAVGFTGTTFSILQRRNAVDTTIAQANFNGDTLNGSGPSGFVLNTADLNVFRIAYGWLGATIVSFQILQGSATWITFHTIMWPNTSATPSIFNPVIPMSAFVNKTNDGTQNLCIATGSWGAAAAAQGSVYGPRANGRFFGFETTISAPGTTETLVLTIEPRATFNGVPNNIMLRLAVWAAGATANNARITRFNIYKNATVTGTSFSNVDTLNSIAQISTTGTYTIGTGTLLVTQIISTHGNGSFVSFFPVLQELIVAEPGSSLTITALAISSNLRNIVMIGWEELF